MYVGHFHKKFQRANIDIIISAINYNYLINKNIESCSSIKSITGLTNYPHHFAYKKPAYSITRLLYLGTKSLPIIYNIHFDNIYI